ncbi:hypothetical protein CMI42_01830 [Candidatus Pacearchaeota archaeon]|nr:hypothetical protein [Candidatus Pacearchaeota archaeon]|tara:strand:+ start:1371 stop:1820 length:450 start_codon:yes stop_codon:yes gene_type:complete
MLPRYHIIVGFIASLSIHYFFQTTPLETLIIFLASFLMDIDHYLFYIYEKKDFSVKKSMKYFVDGRNHWLTLSPKEKKKHKKPIFIFHGIEFWLIILILTQLTYSFWFVLLGFLIHMILDWIDFIIIGDPLIDKFSQIYVYVENLGKKS